ncbi:patatin-like phospholipase family protein [Bradyrhizobium sp. DASA03068]|uniref:patatin-like phospholipase family protein n=1 Tax=Bradyrhizobium sp. BLXBL-01 TaxID=3395915 RepID=UPI003F6F2B3B
MAEFSAAKPCRILSLDGGGAKGFYTIGVLKGLEGLLGAPLHKHFDLVFGTSTGSIIAALICLGHPVDEVHQLYRDHVVKVMSKWFPWTKSKALRELAVEVFGDKDFSAIQTHIGIVATRWHFETPMIFKTAVSQAHGDHGNFVPGFGCKIGDAVQASCSAYPFFQRKLIVTADKQKILTADGGFCANNPTLYALADATEAFKVSREYIRVVSVGVGNYAIVPLAPSRDMKQAYRVGWLRSFRARYQAMLDAAWPEKGAG